LLLRSREFGDQQSVADGDLVFRNASATGVESGAVRRLRGFSSAEELLIRGHGLSRETHLSAEQPAFKDR